MPKIQLRHDTSTNWTTYNPVLLEGECGVETDTNKFKFGDGTTAWNSLDYAGGDLTNYYNKSETDALLDDKQNVLTPDSPIYITSIVRPSNSGMTINSETNRAYSTNQIQMDVAGGTEALYAHLPFTSQDFDYINEHFWDNGYIEIPYNLGQVVCGGSGIEGVIGANLDNFPNLIFGKYVGTNFVPVALYGNNRFYIYYSDTYTFITGGLTTSGTNYLMSLGSDYYGDVPSTRTRISSPEYSRPYGNIGQIYIDPNNSTVTLSFGSNMYLRSETFSNQTVISRLNEVTTVRILPVRDSGNKSTTPLSTLNLGLYNFSTQITTADLITENSLGTNLFDLQGETVQNYLGINIGTGLSVDNNGNLVNTNPTPYSLPTASTSTLGGVKVDGTTITIDNNGVISSSGGGSSYTAGTGIDIANDVISIDDTVVASKDDLDSKQDAFDVTAPIVLANPSVGNAYTYDGTGYVLKSNNTIGDLERIRLCTSETTPTNFPWDGTGELVLDFEFKLKTGLTSTLYSNPIFICYTKNGTVYPTVIHFDGYDLGFAIVGASTVTLSANTDYQIRVVLDVENSSQSLYYKLKSSENYTLVQTSAVDTYSGDATYVQITNSVYGSTPDAPLFEANMSGVKLTANNVVIYESTDGQALSLNIGTGLAVQNGSLVNTNPTAPVVMTGATSSTAGTAGLVPAPATTDTDKYLKGDGTWATIDTSSLADKDLSNLSSTGESRLHALKGYSDEGELLTDAEGLADINSYAHSTFDLSKFTVAGSPTITDDGIASGFSSSNYLTRTQVIDFTKPFEINFVYDTPNDGIDGYIFRTELYFNVYSLTYSNNKYIAFDVGNGSSWVYPGVRGDTPLEFNTKYYIKVIYDGTDIKLYLSTDGKNYTLQNSRTLANPIPSTSSFDIGYILTGSIDLKQFSITVDGVEVFSGNKTGIDTVKPDNYTVVGSPVISDDGIASGFSTSNYVKSTIALSDLKDKSWSVQAGWINKGVLLSTDSDTNPLVTLGSPDYVSYRGGIGLTELINDKNINFYANCGNPSEEVTTGEWARASKNYSSNGFPDWIIATMDFDINTGTYSFYIQDSFVPSKTLLGTYIPSTTSKQLASMYNDSSAIISLGKGAARYIRNSIDLNSFKVYVDGNLVYQPCLKIPYTLSKTGSKIVNSVYRDRVADMYTQFGSAPYYTLSDTDFTLPQGEVYGMIGKRTLRDSYRSGITYWELYSDRTLEIGGTCESGVEYNLPKEFADRNYVLTIPYSAKTESTFIPSATGDFIAKGIGKLQ